MIDKVVFNNNVFIICRSSILDLKEWSSNTWYWLGGVQVIHYKALYCSSSKPWVSGFKKKRISIKTMHTLSVKKIMLKSGAIPLLSEIDAQKDCGEDWESWNKPCRPKRLFGVNGETMDVFGLLLLLGSLLTSKPICLLVHCWLSISIGILWERSQKSLMVPILYFCQI